jgi:rod shape-determining protein MreC
MREKKWIALCVAGLLAAAMMNLPDAASARVKGAVRDGISPLQTVLSGGLREAREIWRYLRGVGNLAAENRALTEEAALLRGEVRRMGDIERENAALRELAGFARKSPQRLVPCEVTGRDATGWWKTARLDKGRRGGVATGRAVLTADGLVGRTVAGGERSTDVLLLTDPACKVGVRLADAAVFGVLSGSGETDGEGAPTCRMEFIPRNEEVPDGAEVVTSGLGGVFPRGLLVGRTLRTELDESGLYQRAEVEPAADFLRLEYAFVIATEEDLAAAEEARILGEAEESGVDWGDDGSWAEGERQ